MFKNIDEISENVKIEVEQIKNENENVLREVRRIERNITNDRAISFSPYSDRDRLFVSSPLEFRPNTNYTNSRITSPGMSSKR